MSNEDMREELFNKLSKLISEASMVEVADALKAIDGNTKVEDNKDNVNHPSHYNREGAIECIDEMIMIFGAKAVYYFCVMNVFKYRYRSSDKNGAEDVKKSDWYSNKAKEIREKYSIDSKLEVSEMNDDCFDCMMGA